VRPKTPLTIVAASLLLFAACTSAPTPPTGSVAAASCSQGATGSQTVTIANFAFSPASLAVTAGTTLTWTNNDSTAHDPTADDGSFHCQPIAPGQSMSFTFSKAGTFAYHCSIHPTMTAKITVS
jgi:plastocyanin